MDPIPYCGPSPVPATLAERWNFDPVALSALAAVALFYAVRGWPARARLERLAFAAGWLVVATTMISPLCALALALFSARVAQHLLLALVAAPLLVLGRLDEVLLPRIARRGSARIEPLGATLAFAACWWLWHAPALYDAALRSNLLYAAMQLTLLASAFALWRVLAGSAGLGGSLLAGLASAVQMGLLGALLTFAPEPLYARHSITAPAWSLSALEDQQLAGLLCWVLGCGALAVAALAAVERGLAEAGRSDAVCTKGLQGAR